MSKKDSLIYEVQVTDDNVCDYLHTELIRLMQKYGSRIKDDLFAIALGPNAFKCFEHWMQKQFTFSSTFVDCPRFHDVRVVCGPLPFFVPLFNERGWHFAHEESKRISSLTGGIDA
jgi:hypothetical protein